MMTVPTSPRDDLQELPTERDFVPNGDLDAQSAWKNFGGLTLEEAGAKFREAPDVHQEDFMWMGSKAFAFYFPVVDNFLRKTPEPDEADERQARILAHCLMMQFRGDLCYVRHLVPRVAGLADFVLAHVNLFDPHPKSGHEVEPAWRELREQVAQISV